MLQEIGALQEKITTATTEAEQKKLREEIEQRRLRYNLLMEHFKRHGVV